MATEAAKTKDGKSAPQQIQKKPKKKPEKKPAKYYESESESDYSSEEVERTRRGHRNESGGGALPISGVGNQVSKTLGDVSKTANGLVGSTTNTLGSVTGSALQNEGGKQSKSDTLRLRLDLNLDVEITLKAKIHGDLELALL
jgi:hypothetical protein